jgi:hypothetical protein
VSTSLFSNDAEPSSDTVRPSEDSARSILGQRVGWCLLGASLWAAPHWFWPLEGGGRLSAGAYIALFGSGSFSLWCVAVAWGSRRANAHASHALAVLTLGIGLALVPCAALAYWVEVATHHRPLGAVSYALGAAVAVLAGVLVARWLLAWCARQPRWGRPVRRIAWGLVGVAALQLILLASSGVQHGLFRAATDIGLGALLALLVVALPAPQRAVRSARWALPLAVTLWGTTAWLLGSDLDLRAGVKSAPVVAGAAGLVWP